MKKTEALPSDLAVNFEAMKHAFSQSASGVYLKLKLDPLDVPRHVAEAPAGQRWMVALVPMMDDLPEPTREEVEEGDRYVQQAGILCKDRDFQAYMVAESEEDCAIQLRRRLGISSRKELKTNPAARRRFDEVWRKFTQARDDAFTL